MEKEILSGRIGRRPLLLGALGLVVGGCGGSNGSASGARFGGTYNGRDAGSFGAAASATVDKDGNVTFWTLYIDNPNDNRDDSFADFGQVRLIGSRFDQTISNVTTTGNFDLRGNLDGRTESTFSGGGGYNWFATREATAPELPPQTAPGTWSGSRTVQGIRIDVLLGITESGNATFLGAFNDLANDTSGQAAVDFYSFESLRFDRSGDGYDYVFDFYGDSIAVNPESTNSLRLSYQFSNNAAGTFRGKIFDVPLQRASTRSVSTLTNLTKPGPGGAGLARTRAGFAAGFAKVKK